MGRKPDGATSDPDEETELQPEPKKWSSKNKWTEEEHRKLTEVVQRLNILGENPNGGRYKWTLVAAELGNGRTSKQCRERWFNVRPDTKKGFWEAAEEDQLAMMHAEVGPTWSVMAKHNILKHRSENAIKNHWNALMRCKSLATRPITLLTSYVSLIKAGWSAGKQTLSLAERLRDMCAAMRQQGMSTQALAVAIEAAGGDGTIQPHHDPEQVMETIRVYMTSGSTAALVDRLQAPLLSQSSMQISQGPASSMAPQQRYASDGQLALVPAPPEPITPTPGTLLGMQSVPFEWSQGMGGMAPGLGNMSQMQHPTSVPQPMTAGGSQQQGLGSPMAAGGNTSNNKATMRISQPGGLDFDSDGDSCEPDMLRAAQRQMDLTGRLGRHVSAPGCSNQTPFSSTPAGMQGMVLDCLMDATTPTAPQPAAADPAGPAQQTHATPASAPSLGSTGFTWQTAGGHNAFQLPQHQLLPQPRSSSMRRQSSGQISWLGRATPTRRFRDPVLTSPLDLDQLMTCTGPDVATMPRTSSKRVACEEDFMAMAGSPAGGDTSPSALQLGPRPKRMTSDMGVPSHPGSTDTMGGESQGMSFQERVDRVLYAGHVVGPNPRPLSAPGGTTTQAATASPVRHSTLHQHATSMRSSLLNTPQQARSSLLGQYMQTQQQQQQQPQQQQQQQQQQQAVTSSTLLDAWMDDAADPVARQGSVGGQCTTPLADGCSEADGLLQGRSKLVLRSMRRIPKGKAASGPDNDESYMDIWRELQGGPDTGDSLAPAPPGGASAQGSHTGSVQMAAAQPQPGLTGLRQGSNNSMQMTTVSSVTGMMVRDPSSGLESMGARSSQGLFGQLSNRNPSSGVLQHGRSGSGHSTQASIPWPSDPITDATPSPSHQPMQPWPASAANHPGTQTPPAGPGSAALGPDSNHSSTQADQAAAMGMQWSTPHMRPGTWSGSTMGAPTTRHLDRSAVMAELTGISQPGLLEGATAPQPALQQQQQQQQQEQQQQYQAHMQQLQAQGPSPMQMDSPTAHAAQPFGGSMLQGTPSRQRADMNRALPPLSPSPTAMLHRPSRFANEAGMFLQPGGGQRSVSAAGALGPTQSELWPEIRDPNVRNLAADQSMEDLWVTLQN